MSENLLPAATAEALFAPAAAPAPPTRGEGRLSTSLDGWW